MQLYEVVINKVQSDGVAVVFYLLTVAIGQAREPTYVHPHG